MATPTRIEQIPYGQQTQVKVFSKNEVEVVFDMILESDLSDELFQELIVILHGQFDVCSVIRRKVDPDDAGNAKNELEVVFQKHDHRWTKHYLQGENGELRVSGTAKSALLDSIWSMIGDSDGV